jgi:hypothetical protein
MAVGRGTQLSTDRISGTSMLGSIFALATLVAPTLGMAQSNADQSLGWESKLDYSPQLYTAANPIAAPARDYTGLPVAGWMMYATVLTGVVWDDNVFQTHGSKTGDWAARLKPELEAVYNDGMHDTKISASVDARFYAANDDANVANANVDVSHVWEVQRDLVIRTEVGGWRKTEIDNSGTVLTPHGEETIVDPLEDSEFHGSTSIQKSFGSIFGGLGFTASRTIYDDVEDSLGQTIKQSGRNETIYSMSGRAGAWISPVFYAFVEPSQNWRSFDDNILHSNGQRVIAGLGTDRLSLFRGELFGGYQRQDYDRQQFNSVSGAVFGGSLSWYPTRDLVWTLNADRSLGDSTLASAGNQDGSPIETTSASLKVDYLFSNVWTMSAQAQYAFIDYKDSTREDNLWQVGTTISYDIRRNWAVTFDYQYTDLKSSFDTNSFNRNVFTVGATYKY